MNFLPNLPLSYRTSYHFVGHKSFSDLSHCAESCRKIYNTLTIERKTTPSLFLCLILPQNIQHTHNREKNNPPPLFFFASSCPKIYNTLTVEKGNPTPFLSSLHDLCILGKGEPKHYFETEQLITCSHAKTTIMIRITT